MGVLANLGLLGFPQPLFPHSQPRWFLPGRERKEPLAIPVTWEEGTN